MLLISGALQTVITGDLLTGNAVTTAWQNCDGSDLISEDNNQFDVHTWRVRGVSIGKPPLWKASNTI